MNTTASRDGAGELAADERRGRPVALRTEALAKAFGATQALRSCSFELLRRRGALHRRRERIGQVDAREDPLRRPRRGCRSHSAAREDDRCDPVPAEGRCRGSGDRVPGGVGRRAALGPRERLDGHGRNAPERGSRAGAEAPGTGRAGFAVGLVSAARPPGGALSLSERQACCLARALVRDPQILILDEATSALDVPTRDRLFALVRARCAQGTAVIFISHRMDEISEIGDRCTVMRSGETVRTLERGEATAEQLVKLITGAEHLTGDVAERPHRQPGEVVLDVPGLTLRAGELVGLAGLEGHGQDAFLHSVARTGGGDVAYVPRERRSESLFESKSARENFGIATLGLDTRRGLLAPKRTRRRLADYVERLKIKLGDPDDAITTLSGGNQQKLVMARWLATEPRVLLLNDPTRGVDIGAKRDLYDLLLDLAGLGVAIVMLSTEVDEHVELMDRVLVFRDGRVNKELQRGELSRQSIIGAFFG